MGQYLTLVVVVGVLIAFVALTQYISLTREIPPPWFLDMVERQGARLEEQDKRVTEMEKQLTILMERMQ